VFILFKNIKSSEKLKMLQSKNRGSREACAKKEKLK
jgi:hypothetical protein